MSDRDLFTISNITRVDARNIRISGDLILKGDERGVISWEIPDSQSSSDPTRKPPASMPSPREVKWVLLGRNSEFYQRIKSYAEAVGYQTIEQ